MDTTVTGEVLLAHPVAVLAIPAFIPVVVIVATVLWIARKDRLAAAAEEVEISSSTAPEPVVAPTEPRRPWRDRLPRLVIGDED